MRAYIVGKITFFGDSPRVRSIHYDLFHGVCTRSGASMLCSVAPRLGDTDPVPLWIVRTSHDFPPLTSPSLNYVVTELLAEQFTGLPHVQLSEVRIEKLVDCYFAKGDFSVYTGAGRRRSPPRDTGVYLKSLPATTATTAVPRMFEVLVAGNRELKSHFDDAVPVQVAVGNRESDSPVDVHVSPRMLEEYPLQWGNRGHLMSEAVFRILEPHLDPDFFAWNSFEV